MVRRSRSRRGGDPAVPAPAAPVNPGAAAWNALNLSQPDPNASANAAVAAKNVVLPPPPPNYGVKGGRRTRRHRKTNSVRRKTRGRR